MKAQIFTNKILFHKTLIIDIETVSAVSTFDELPKSMQHHWQHKSQFIRGSVEEQNNPAISFTQKAGIYAEFGKIVSICLGFIEEQPNGYQVRLKAVSDNNEQTLLKNFSDIILQMEAQHKDVIFCGHNIKEFDLPYICRRMLVHGMDLPTSLQLSGKKPWEILHEDTLELWRFGDYKHYISLDLLATCLGVASSKTDMDGSMVGEAYWKENQLERITNYCLADVYTTTMVYMKLKGLQQPVTAVYV